MNTTLKIEIIEHFPSVLALNINYAEPDIDPINLLKLLITIPDIINVNEIFDTTLSW